MEKTRKIILRKKKNMDRTLGELINELGFETTYTHEKWARGEEIKFNTYDKGYYYGTINNGRDEQRAFVSTEIGFKPVAVH